MKCNTCVELTQSTQDMGYDLIRLRQSNKVLRTVNGMLRRLLTDLHTKHDEVFLALCESADKAAECAMGELWGSGRFDCGPQDFDIIVERCLAAIREYDERRKNPSQSFHTDRDLGDESDHYTLPHGF